jgi:hypothetical protein
MTVLNDAVDLLKPSKKRTILQLPQTGHDEEGKGDEEAGDQERGEGGEEKQTVEDELSCHGKIKV